MDEKGVNPGTEEDRWDEHHNDPQADVVLVSEDNVSFRVNSWYFKQKSGFVRTLMSLPSSQAMSTAPIPINGTSRHVRLFVDMVYSSNIAAPALEMNDYKPLLHICEHLQALELQSCLWQGFRNRLLTDTSAPFTDLWELFGMAAREDDNLTCSRIILAFHDKDLHYDDVCSQPAERYQGIPSLYLATLFTGNFGWSHKHAGRPAYKVKGFCEMAQRFANMNVGVWELTIDVAYDFPYV